MDLRIKMLAPFYPDDAEIAGGHIGGVERDVMQISRGLAKRGADVTVVASSNRDSSDRDGRVKIERVKRKAMLFRTPMFNWKDHLKTGVDVINPHGTYPLLSDRSASAAMKKKIPSVLTYHFDGRSNSLPGKVMTEVYYRTLARQMKRHTKIVATTRSYARFSRFLKDVPPKQLEIIPNGVDTEVFKPSVKTSRVLDKYSLKEGYVLFVGRLVPYKGLPYLLDAVKGSGLDLVIAGKGPLEQELKARRVGRFIGYVPDKDLPALYKAASVTVLPSIYPSEAFGICLIESMACGTPVVGTDLAGVSEIGSLGGTTVKKADPKALLKGIKKVAGRSWDAKKLHAGMVKRFSWDIVVDSYLELFKEACRP